MEVKQLDLATRDEAFGQLLSMSDRGVDEKAKIRIRTFLGRPNAEIKDELLGLIDDCVHAAWTSDFEIWAMNTIWENIGGSKEELQDRNRQLDDPSGKEKLRSRFKWQCQ